MIKNREKNGDKDLNILFFWLNYHFSYVIKNKLSTYCLLSTYLIFKGNGFDWAWSKYIYTKNLAFLTIFE